MNELERKLVALSTDVDWPRAPRVELQLGKRRHRIPRLAVALALVVCALGIAFAVPQARSAILRLFDIGGVTIVRVETLPPAQERPLAADLGSRISRRQAEQTLLGPFRLPKIHGTPRLYALGNSVSTVLAVPQPVLLTELSLGGGGIVPEKILGPATKVEAVRVVHDGDGVWLTGARHIVVFPPAPPRLAGNVLLWGSDGITFRLEGRGLDEDTALRLAREITR